LALLLKPVIRETLGIATMNNDTGARYQIVVDGVPRSNRDTRKTALEAAEHLRRKNPNVVVKDLRTGEAVK
jgi:hypothetical protein